MDDAIKLMRLQRALHHISICEGAVGEIYPCGPSDSIYDEDGNTLIEHVAPWLFRQGKGATFLEAVEDDIKNGWVVS